VSAFAGVDSAAAGADEDSLGIDGATLVEGALPLPLKSVAYQPDPFNWNPAAVTCFLKAGLEQEGQTSSGASDIFCNTSLANPQASHL
jgi:hypothetical protein